MKRVLQLSGYWKFSIGDDLNWANPDFDDKEWDEIRVPSPWEHQGYGDYNGFAWYRKTIHIGELDRDEAAYLVFGRIDDVDEVYLNGKLLSGTGQLPPDYKSAYNYGRKYVLPRDLIKANDNNTIAIRVYDSYMEGGIINGPVGIFIDDNYQYLDFDLSGEWKFHLGDNRQWKKSEFDDEIWESVVVPREWEAQGYFDYDGYAWYRKEFVLPEDLKKGKIYLSLGKIDDEDWVYLNGKKIADVFDLNKNGEYPRRGMEYNARRIYEIPQNVINKEGVNVLAVRVNDTQMRGGIYEGPIGIMKEKNMKEYRRRHHSSQSLWDFILDEFFMD
jgi:sialate O-acetylesterase